MNFDVERAPGLMSPGNTEGHYLAQSGLSLYNSDKRPRRDNWATIAYIALAALTVFWGIAAFVHT